MGLKLKIFSDYENVSPHISISVERDVPDSMDDNQLVEYGGKLYQLCRSYVEKEAEEDIKKAKAGLSGKHIGDKK